MAAFSAFFDTARVPPPFFPAAPLAPLLAFFTAAAAIRVAGFFFAPAASSRLRSSLVCFFFSQIRWVCFLAA